MRRVLTRSRGERMKPVMTSEATGSRTAVVFRGCENDDVWESGEKAACRIE